MEPVTVKEFICQLELAITRILPNHAFKIVELNPHRFKGRIALAPGMNVDIFYGCKNGRVDLALINEDKRIWGIDNLGGWHIHPLWNEEEHIKAEFNRSDC